MTTYRIALTSEPSDAGGVTVTFTGIAVAGEGDDEQAAVVDALRALAFHVETFGVETLEAEE